MTFRKGQKVICIDASLPHPEIMKHFTHWLVKDKVYVVRGTRFSDGRWSVLLEGMVNPLMYNPELMGNCEPGYAMERFRLIDEEDLDLLLEGILEEVNEEQLINV